MENGQKTVPKQTQSVIYPHALSKSPKTKNNPNYSVVFDSTYTFKPSPTKSVEPIAGDNDIELSIDMEDGPFEVQKRLGYVQEQFLAIEKSSHSFYSPRSSKNRISSEHKQLLELYGKAEEEYQEKERSIESLTEELNAIKETVRTGQRQLGIIDDEFLDLEDKRLKAKRKLLDMRKSIIANVQKFKMKLSRICSECFSRFSNVLPPFNDKIKEIIENIKIQKVMLKGLEEEHNELLKAKENCTENGENVKKEMDIITSERTQLATEIQNLKLTHTIQQSELENLKEDNKQNLARADNMENAYEYAKESREKTKQIMESAMKEVQEKKKNLQLNLQSSEKKKVEEEAELQRLKLLREKMLSEIKTAKCLQEERETLLNTEKEIVSQAENEQRYYISQLNYIKNNSVILLQDKNILEKQCQNKEQELAQARGVQTELLQTKGSEVMIKSSLSSDLAKLQSALIQKVRTIAKLQEEKNKTSH